MALTGGTLAPPAPKAPAAAPKQPNVRKAAATRALGGPKGVTRAPKAATRMPRPAKAAAKLPKTPAPKAAAKQVLYNPGQNSPAEIHQIAANAAKETLASELAPLKGESKEIASNEQGASERFTTNTGAANQTLGNLATNQEASAKTFQNQAAENALTAGKAIETSGQTQASMTGGYISPELRAQLQAEGTQGAAAGAANNTFAQNASQAGANFLTGVRGAAALRAVEGQGKITGYFQKQAGKVQEAENTRIAKVGADQANDEAKLGAENVKEGINLQALGIKGTLASNTIKDTASKEAHERAESEASRSTAEKNRLLTPSEIQKNEAAIRSSNVKAEAASKELGSKIAKNYADAKQAIAKANAETNLSTAGRKYLSQVEASLAVANSEYRAATKANPRANPHVLYQGIVESLERGLHTGSGGAEGKPMPTNLVHAALSLVYNGKLLGKAAQEAQAQGLNPELLEGR